MKQILTPDGKGGEYSTVYLPDGTIETCLFRKDGSSEVIGRTRPLELESEARRHIAEWNA